MLLMSMATNAQYWSAYSKKMFQITKYTNSLFHILVLVEINYEIQYNFYYQCIGSGLNWVINSIVSFIVDISEFIIMQ